MKYTKKQILKTALLSYLSDKREELKKIDLDILLVTNTEEHNRLISEYGECKKIIDVINSILYK